MPNPKAFKDNDTLTFAERWEKIGLPAEMPAESRPASAASIPDKSYSTKSSTFSNLNMSLKLRCLSAKATKQGSSKGVRRKARPCEAGDPCRLLKASASDSALTTSSMSTRRSDFLECVADGLRQHALQGTQTRGGRVAFALPGDPDGTGCSQPPSVGAESNEEDGSVTKTQLREAWGPGATTMRGALGEMMSPMGRAQRRMSRGRLVTLKAFHKWCMDSYGSTEAAWSALDVNGLGSIDRDDFVAILQNHSFSFPMGELGAKTVFFLLDAGDSSKITKEDFLVELGKVATQTVECTRKGRHPSFSSFSVNGSQQPSKPSSAISRDSSQPRTRPLSHDNSRSRVSATTGPVSAGGGAATQTRRLSQMGFDPLEAEALGLYLFTGEKTNYDQQWTMKLKRLREQDEIMGQLLEFLYKAFGTLKIAFCQIDVNGNGHLSKSEFVDSMLQDVRSKACVEEHIQEVYNRADQNGSGALSLSEFLDKLESGDLLLERLATFFMSMATTSKSALGAIHTDAKLDHGSRRERLERGFRSMGLGTGKAELITRTVFANLLSQMQYQEWHARDLFHRLDVDNSGEITLAEFTAFLMPNPPRRKPTPAKVVVPEGFVSAIASSYKVAKLGTGRTETTRPAECNRSRPASAAEEISPAATWLERLERGKFRERPDYLTLVRDGLSPSLQARSQSGSEMRHRGHQVFSRCVFSDVSVQLAGGLDDFSIDHSRDQTEGKARTEHW